LYTTRNVPTWWQWSGGRRVRRNHTSSTGRLCQIPPYTTPAYSSPDANGERADTPAWRLLRCALGSLRYATGPLTTPADTSSPVTPRPPVSGLPASVQADIVHWGGLPPQTPLACLSSPASPSRPPRHPCRGGLPARGIPALAGVLCGGHPCPPSGGRRLNFARESTAACQHSFFAGDSGVDFAKKTRLMSCDSLVVVEP